MKRSLVKLITLVLILATRAAVFSANAPDPAEVQKLRAILEAPPPDPKEHNRPQLAQIYLQRGKAAGELGESARAVKELNAGIQVVGPKSPASYDLHNELANRHADRGEHRRTVESRKAALAVAQTLPRQLGQISLIAALLTTLGEREEARQSVARAEGLLSGARSNKAWGNQGDLWTSRVAMASARFNEAFGYLKESEEEFKRCNASFRTYMRRGADLARSSLFLHVYCTQRWIEVTLRQGRLREATAFADDLRLLTRDFAETTGRPLFVSRTAPTTARILIEQGLLKEAKDLLEQTIAHYKEELSSNEDVGDASSLPVNSRRLLAAMDMVQGNWQKAEATFRETKRPVALWGYTLLRQNRVKDALQMLDKIIQESDKRYDDKSLTLWEDRAFHALAVGASGQREQAVKTLAAAIPKILEMSRPEGTSGEAGLLNSARLNWMLDGYIELLSDLHRAGVRVEGVDIISDALRYSDVARGSRVQRALSAAILRASINDPTLAAVVRRSQDLEYQVKAAAEDLAAYQSGENTPEKEKLVNAQRAQLERLRTENEEAQQELKRKLPDYSELLSPKPLTVADAQKLLKPQEALISIYTMQKQTLVWAVPAQGQVSFVVADLPLSTVADVVTKLRKSLDPSDADIGQVPSFDFNTANDLYQKLLRPVEAGWKNAKELIIVPHGSLSELPLSVLVTQPYQPNKAGIPFADHAAAPWLIKNASISYLPALSALASLRRSTTQSGQRPFIAFGDPSFGSAAAPPTAVASRGMTRRNSKAPVAPGTPASNLALLQPLPDTADEVREIAKILRADEGRDVFLGRRASEQQVKNTDLSNYRVVMFATHGLVTGELPDLNQPALALSNPAVTGEKDDGLLTLAEILALKLRADWVVLSACNTASADGQASEAVSGFGRAFFFAGAKAMLVSHWPVETVSTKLLTTELFRRQSTNATLSRAQALRDAALAVMQRSAGSSYSYAHPMFWAPFVIVGDGG